MEKTSIALTGGPEERKEADREGKEEEDPGREMPTSGHWGNEWRQTEVTRRSHRAHSDHLFDHVYNLVILFHSIQCCLFVFIRETAKQMLEYNCWQNHWVLPKDYSGPIPGHISRQITIPTPIHTGTEMELDPPKSGKFKTTPSVHYLIVHHPFWIISEFF